MTPLTFALVVLLPLVVRAGDWPVFRGPAGHDIAPAALAADLEKLRAELLAGPYFKDAPSMQAAARKTALYFHAKDDLPEIRREVFKLLQRHPLRFSAVVRNKQTVLDYVRTRNQRDPQYRYKADDLYDHTVRRLFKERLHKHEGYCIRFAIRGNAHRTAAFRAALEQARERFAQERGITVVSKLDVQADYPTGQVALQAVDYFLWALQRVFEKREDRFLELLWPQCSLVVDVDDTREREYGAYYTKQKPLRAAAIEKWLRDIGSTRLGASLTRHGADFCPSNREQDGNNV